MTEGISKLEARAGRWASRLRRDLSPETDLWPRIAARIDAKRPKRAEDLPQAIETGRDLWPGIHARLETIDSPGTLRRRRGRGTRFAAAAGIVAAAALTAVLTTRLDDPPLPGDPPAAVDSTPASGPVELPAWMADALGQFGGTGLGTPAALGDVARSIERDFLMVRSQRLRIEQALVAGSGDTNLRTQWRQVYLAELRLIDETQKLATIYGTRVPI